MKEAQINQKGKLKKSISTLLINFKAFVILHLIYLKPFPRQHKITFSSSSTLAVFMLMTKCRCWMTQNQSGEYLKRFLYLWRFLHEWTSVRPSAPRYGVVKQEVSGVRWTSAGVELSLTLGGLHRVPAPNSLGACSFDFIHFAVDLSEEVLYYFFSTICKSLCSNKHRGAVELRIPIHSNRERAERGWE